MNFKKYLVGIAMILTSAAAFAKPNAITLDGSFIYQTDNSQYKFIQGLILADNSNDYKYITINNGSLPANQTFNLYDGSPISYSIQLSNLTGNVQIRFNDQNSSPELQCGWIISSSTSTMNPPIAASYNAPGCSVHNAYDFEYERKS